MQRVTRFLTALTLVTLAGEMAHASGAGAAIYVPSRSRSTVQQASHLQYQAHGACVECQRLGFACVDHATPPPCQAEGGCYPSEPFGFTVTRWRRWPGAAYGDGPEPSLADPLNELDIIEPPAPAEEDRQAPPPIADTPSVTEEQSAPAVPGGDFTPPAEEPGGGEFDIPAFPPTPAPPARPTPPGLDQEPALPFGATVPKPSQDNARPDGWRPPALPASLRLTPPRATTPASDAPPALPDAFTARDYNLPTPPVRLAAEAQLGLSEPLYR